MHNILTANLLTLFLSTSSFSSQKVADKSNSDVEFDDMVKVSRCEWTKLSKLRATATCKDQPQTYFIQGEAKCVFKYQNTQITFSAKISCESKIVDPSPNECMNLVSIGEDVLIPQSISSNPETGETIQKTKWNTK